MKILALTFGDSSCASTYYRVQQYVEMLRDDGIQMDQSIGAVGNIPSATSIEGYDVVLVQKKLFPRRIVLFLRKHSRRLVFDIDDATWHPHGRKHSFITRIRTKLRVKWISQSADVCTTPNSFISKYLENIGAFVKKVPMALQSKDWMPKLNNASSKVYLGWSGAPSNLRYLESIESILREILTTFPQSELVVLCGRRPNFQSDLRFRHILWTPGCEKEVVPKFDIGLLPLDRSDFTDGKTPIKALQYLASGLPVVGCPLSGTLEIAEKAKSFFLADSSEQWVKALSNLIDSDKFRRMACLQSRSAFDLNFSCSVVYPYWKKALLGTNA